MGLALTTGDILVGKYRLDQVIGRGGMGTVHLATHLVIGQRVAIKIVNPSPSEHAYVLARFVREARAAALLESEHVVRILDVDALEDATPFLVMEYLAGSDLGAILRKSGRLPLPEAIDYVLQACEALAEAHAAGIVHRDLKPSNLFRAETARTEPIIKLLDFGISKLAAPGEDLSLTDTQAVIGSPLFMSPEQLLSSRDVDHRTDIWSIGVTLYQLLAGALPFEASSASALGAQIAARAPRPLSVVLPEVPRDLEAVVMRCLARAPEDRFFDIASLAQALGPWGTTDAVASVTRAAARGLRGRLAPPMNEAQAPSVVEASGERWTQSRRGAAPYPTEEPHVNAASVAARLAASPAPAFPIVATPREALVAGPTPRTRSRAALIIGLGMLFLVVAAVALLLFAKGRRDVESTHQPPTPSATAATIATPATTASTTSTTSTTSNSTTSSSATIATASSTARPPPRGLPRAAKPGTTWSKDPSELELK